MNFFDKQIQEREQIRSQLTDLFKSLVTRFTQKRNLSMHGDLSLAYGAQDRVFNLDVFSSWHRQSNRGFPFYTFMPFEPQKELAEQIIIAIEADDFEKIIELSGLEMRTSVQRYIDRTYGPYICHECGKIQHDPFNVIEVAASCECTILGCDECNTAHLSDIYNTDMMEYEQ